MHRWGIFSGTGWLGQLCHSKVHRSMDVDLIRVSPWGPMSVCRQLHCLWVFICQQLLSARVNLWILEAPCALNGDCYCDIRKTFLTSLRKLESERYSCTAKKEVIQWLCRTSIPLSFQHLSTAFSRYGEIYTDLDHKSMGSEIFLLH